MPSARANGSRQVEVLRTPAEHRGVEVTAIADAPIFLARVKKLSTGRHRQTRYSWNQRGAPGLIRSISPQRLCRCTALVRRRCRAPRAARRPADKARRRACTQTPGPDRGEQDRRGQGVANNSISVGGPDIAQHRGTIARRSSGPVGAHRRHATGDVRPPAHSSPLRARRNSAWSVGTLGFGRRSGDVDVVLPNPPAPGGTCSAIGACSAMRPSYR